MNDYQSTFNSLLQNAIQHQDDNDSVDNKLVKQSTTIIDILRIRTLADAFLVWACFNYLNFAVKKTRPLVTPSKAKLSNAFMILVNVGETWISIIHMKEM